MNRLVPALLAASLAACGDGAITGLDLSGIGAPGPLPPQAPAGTVHFEPRSLSLRVGETADVTLRLDPRLRSLVLQWWGSGDFGVMTVDDFVCEPEPSCGLVRYEAAERAFFQLQDTGSIRMRVTATAPGRDGVLATVNTCAPSVFFCDDRSTDYVPVEVRP